MCFVAKKRRISKLRNVKLCRTEPYPPQPGPAGNTDKFIMLEETLIMRKNTEVFVAVSAALLALLAGNAPSFAQNALSGSVKEQINTVQSAIQKKGD